MTIVDARTRHLFRDGLATVDDPPALIDALLELRRLGVHGTTMDNAVACLRARPIVNGEWLVVTGDGHAYRFSHCCLDDETAFPSARVIRLAPATAVGESGTATATPAALGAAEPSPLGGSIP